jgi:hypothetical protein
MGLNPVRTCIGCGASDDHPRHVIAVGDIEVTWHMDCHHLATGCEVCAHQLADAPKGAKGDKLRGHLVGLPPTAIEHHDAGGVTISALGEEK